MSKVITCVVSKSDYMGFWEDALIRMDGTTEENQRLSLHCHDRRAYFRNFTGNYDSIIQYEVMGQPFARGIVREIHLIRKSEDGLFRSRLLPINVSCADFIGNVPLDQQNVPLLALKDETLYFCVDCQRFELLEGRMYASEEEIRKAVGTSGWNSE